MAVPCSGTEARDERVQVFVSPAGTMEARKRKSMPGGSSLNKENASPGKSRRKRALSIGVTNPTEVSPIRKIRAVGVFDSCSREKALFVQHRKCLKVLLG